MRADSSRRVYMLGTFGLQPKATLSRRALGMAHALSARGWQFELATTPWDHPSDAGREWVEQGVRVRNTRVVRPTLAPLAAAELTRWGNRFRPDLVHLFKPKGFGDLAARWLSRSLPLVVDMDDWEGDGGWNDIGGYGPVQRRLFDWQERSWPARGTVITAASACLRQRAIDLGADPSHVHYIPNGLSVERFKELAGADPRPADLGFVDAPAVLLYTRFVEFDPATLVPLMLRLRQGVPGARLIIAGSSADGRAERVLQAAAGQVGLSDGFVWLGWIEPSRLASIAAACQVAIHPFDDTRLNAAKSSVKLLELLAAGVPVVTTAVGENRRFVDSGVSGLLVPPGDTRALADATAELLRSPQRGRELALRARRYVGQCFLWERLADKVEDAYLQALQDAPKR